MEILVSVVESSFSLVGVVNIFFSSLGMKNYSHWLKFETQHQSIEISNANNMTLSIMHFLNYVRMIEFLINNCLIKQTQILICYRPICKAHTRFYSQKQPTRDFTVKDGPSDSNFLSPLFFSLLLSSLNFWSWGR